MGALSRAKVWGFTMLWLLAACIPDDNRNQLNRADIYVIDGDTIDVAGVRYRLIGFDTPETYFAKCAHEREIGLEATNRLRHSLSQAQVIEMAEIARSDRYNRKLGRLFVDGEDVADIMVMERLARRYDGGVSAEWC